MSERKELGKITNCRVGFGGYQDAHMGIWFQLGGASWGVGDGRGHWWTSIVPDERSKWTEATRTESFAEIMRYINGLLKDAGVDDTRALVGVPVEVTFDGMTLTSWRILKEVL